MSTAQHPDAFAGVRAEIAKIGPRFDLAINDAMRVLYEPHLDPTPAKIEQRDLVYGVHERHRLDLFSAGGTNLPIVLYVHGGGFVGGDKRATDLFYANVGRYFASKGFLAATMNYRLGGTDPWPAGPQDVSAAVDWLAANAGAHGGDGARIALLGQSSGSCHAASYVFDADTTAAAARRLRAVALMSGYYRVKFPLTPGQKSYFGDDASQYDDRSPAYNVARNTTLPILLTLAEFDPGAIAQQTLDFAAALTASRGACPPLQWLAGHNHVSSALSIGTAQDDVAGALAAFFGEHLAA